MLAPLLSLALLSPAHAALTPTQDAQVRVWLYTEHLPCGATRIQAQSTFDLTCAGVPWAAPANICVTLLNNGCVANDADGDGWDATAGDCDDTDPAVNPDATEVCNGVDDDCDGLVDDGAGCASRPWTGTVAPGDASVTLYGAAGNAMGSSMDVGDVDGDGIGDLLWAARGANTAWLALGPLDAGLTTATADATYAGPMASNFGWMVSLPGDLDGDGHGEVVVGAPDASLARGATYVWSSDTLGSRGFADADATITGGSGNSDLGVRVAPAGDQDGDGLVDLLVGAWLDDTGTTDAGTTFVFAGPLAGTYTPSAAWATLTGEHATDWSGYGADGGADLDGDGWDDLLVGADGEDTGGTQAGAAYVVYGPVSGTIPLASADARRYGTATYEYVGHAIRMVGDVTGDGQADWATSAFGRDELAHDDGTLYVYASPVAGGATAATGAIGVGPGIANAYFGYTIAPAGDVDGDGANDLLVSALLDDEGASNAGAVYLLYGPVDASFDFATDSAKFVEDRSTTGMGYNHAGGADLDGDGLDDVVAGAKDNDAAGTGAGALHVYLTGGG